MVKSQIPSQSCLVSLKVWSTDQSFFCFLLMTFRTISGLLFHLFANGSELLRNIRSTVDCEMLQRDLNSLVKWKPMSLTFHSVSRWQAKSIRLYPPWINIWTSSVCQILWYNYHWQLESTYIWGHLKATRTLAFAPRQTKEVVYKTLVRPQVECATLISHPYLRTQMQQIEKVQRTAAKWTCKKRRNISSVDSKLSELEWPSLETSREQPSLTFFHKIHFGIVYIDEEKYLTPHPVWEKLGHFSLMNFNIVGILHIVMP